MFQAMDLNGLSLIGVVLPASAVMAAPPRASDELAAQLSNEDARKRLLQPTSGSHQSSPSWARMLVSELPRPTAAFLKLDLARRTKSPIDRQLRAAMRWVVAHANRCVYAEAYAVADARLAGLADRRLEALRHEGFPGRSESERAAPNYARSREPGYGQHPAT